MAVHRRAAEASTTKMAAADTTVFFRLIYRVAIGWSILAEIFLYGGVTYLQSK